MQGMNVEPYPIKTNDYKDDETTMVVMKHSNKIDDRQAYEAALILRKYCKQQDADCSGCIFRMYRYRSDVVGRDRECRLGFIEYYIPHMWNLDGARKKVK